MTTAQQTYVSAEPGHQSAPGLIVFRYDAELFYANANRFVDDVRPDRARPRPGALAGPRRRVARRHRLLRRRRLDGLLDYLEARQITFALARADPGLLDTLEHYGLRKRIPDNRHFASLSDAVAAFQGRTPDRRAASPHLPAGPHLPRRTGRSPTDALPVLSPRRSGTDRPAAPGRGGAVADGHLEGGAGQQAGRIERGQRRHIGGHQERDLRAHQGRPRRTRCRQQPDHAAECLARASVNTPFTSSSKMIG